MDALADLIGDSPAMVALRRQVQQLVRSAAVAVRPPVAADPRRDRIGQGPARAVAASSRAARGPAVHRRQLRRHPGAPARGRAVRLREGRLHRRAPGQARPVSARPSRHALSRRDRPARRAPSGQAPHRARAARRAAPRRHPRRARRRVDRGRHQRGSPRRRRGPELSPGSLPSARRHHAAPCRRSASAASTC